MNFVKEVSECAGYDCIVAGGGPAGFGAAVAAARQGIKTLLIEANGCMGGVSTAGALPFYLGAMGGSIPYPQMINKNIAYSQLNRTFKAVGGIFEEMTKRINAQGGGVGPCKVAQADKYPALDRFGCHDEFTFDIETGKRILDEMATESGLDILYYSTALGVRKENNKIVGIYVSNKSGILYFPCKTLIDCTGDADMVYDAGYETYKGDRITGEMTHAGLVAHIENIDSEKMAEYIENGGDPWFKDICKKAQSENPDADLPERLIIFPMVQSGVFMVNGGTSRRNIDGTSGFDRTELTLWGRRRAKALNDILFRKYIAGGENARIRLTAYYTGIRETRRIVGEKTLTEELILCKEKPNDIIALAGRHFDLSRTSTGNLKQPFADKSLPFGAAGIPFGALIPKNSRNILAAGRCIAADGQALGPVRIMSTCMAVGQAAGTAAGLAVKGGLDFNDIDIGILRDVLRNDGAIVDL